MAKDLGGSWQRIEKIKPRKINVTLKQLDEICSFGRAPVEKSSRIDNIPLLQIMMS